MGILEYLDWGVAAVFAVCMFLVYRRVVNQMRDDRKFMEDRLSDVIKDYNEAAHANTRALTELITWLKAKNSH